MKHSKTQTVPICCINEADEVLRCSVGMPTWVPVNGELPIAYDKTNCVLWAWGCIEGTAGWFELPETSNITMGNGPPVEPPKDCEMNLYIDRETQFLYIWDGSQFNIFSSLGQPITIEPVQWNVNETVENPTNAGITIDITSLGFVTATGDNTGLLENENWGISPPNECDPTEYEVQGVITGSLPVSSPNSGFNPISAGNLTWYWQQTSVGQQISQLTITVQPIGDASNAAVKIVDIALTVTGVPVLIPTVMHSTPPYPVEFTDSLAMGGSLRQVGLTRVTTDSLDSSMSVVSGEMNTLLIDYDDYDPEAFDTSAFVVGGSLDALLVTYDNYDPEAFDTSATTVSGVLSSVLIEVVIAPEAFDSNGTLLSGTLS